MSFEGLWSGRVAGLVGRRRSLAGCAGLSMAPGGVPLSTCVWPLAPANAGGLHRWAGGCASGLTGSWSRSTAWGFTDLDGSTAVGVVQDSTGGDRP